MFFEKIRNILIYLKSKRLKKRSKRDFSREKDNFKKFIENKKFTSKWFLNNFEIFSYFLPYDKDVKFNYLEIGCFEGLSSLYVLERYKKINATFVDIWDYPNKNSLPLSQRFGEIEKKFDENLSAYNFQKIKSDSVIAMRNLLREEKLFDFIYIDGSHNGEDILSDGIEAFKILKKNGIIFFDDFLQYDKTRKIQSYQGIINFLTLFKNSLKILYFQNNLVIKKV